MNKTQILCFTCEIIIYLYIRVHMQQGELIRSHNGGKYFIQLQRIQYKPKLVSNSRL